MHEEQSYNLIPFYVDNFLRSVGYFARCEMRILSANLHKLRIFFFHQQQNHPNNLNPPGLMGVPAGSRSNRSSSTSNMLKPTQQRRLQVEQRLLNKSSSSSSTSNATQEFLTRLRRMEIPQLKRPPPQHPTQNVVMAQVHRQQPSSSSRYLQSYFTTLKRRL